MSSLRRWIIHLIFSHCIGQINHIVLSLPTGSKTELVEVGSGKTSRSNFSSFGLFCFCLFLSTLK